MKNILAEKIKSANLTKTQRMIADYFINNQERIGSLSSMEVAQEIGVSDASIIRFSRAIGFEGFADLKENIYHMLVENAFSGLSLTERMEQNSEKYDGEKDLAGQFQQIMTQNMMAAFRNNSMDDFEKLVEYIIKAQSKYIIGLRGCRGIATDFSRLLSFMLPGVRCLTDGECVSIHSLQDVNEDDVVLMFAFSRFYKMDLGYLDMAKRYGAKICLVLNDLSGPLNSYADLILLSSTGNMSFFNSKIGAEVIAEYLLTLIGRRVDYKARIQERDELLSSQRL